MSELLEGRVAIVTGAAKGIGRAIAARLGEAGAKVVVADIDAAGAERAAAAIDGAESAACDVAEEAEVAGLVDEVVDRHGALDVFVANAGIATVRPLVEMPLEEWRAVLAVNLDGTFLCTKHAGAAMAKQESGGSIINIASIKAFGGSPATGHYGAAKAAVVSLTKTAALELRAHGVRVNAICPGWVGTDLVFDHRAELEQALGLEALGLDFEAVIGQLQGRLASPEEITGLALFLASERSRFSNGSAFVVDGGATASLV